MKKTPIFLIGNNKGGVGKSTTSLNLTAALVEKGKKIIYVDLDESTNSTSHLTPDSSQERSFPISSLMMDDDIDIIDCIRWDLRLPNVGLIRGDRGTKIELEKYLKGDDEIRMNVAIRLNKRLAELDGKADYIIIDISPSQDNTVFMGLMSATHIIGITDGSRYSEEGLINFMQNSDMKLVKEFNPKQKILGVILNKIDFQSVNARALIGRDRIGFLNVVPVCIPTRQEIDDNSQTFEFAIRPNSKKKTVLSELYRELADYVIDQVVLEAE